MSNLKSLICISALLFLISCKKERISIPFAQQVSPTGSQLKGIWFTDGDNGFSVGGEKFLHGEVLTTLDGGANWQSDTLTNKRLNALYFLPSGGRGFIVGFDGYYLTKPSAISNWEFYGLPNTTELHSVAFKNDNAGIAVGGAGFRAGVIQVFSGNPGTVDTLIQSLDHELRDVCHLENDTWVIAGYGLVMRSTDGGQSWQPNGISGDFFYAMHFPTPQTGYIVGLYGMILKTVDGGQNWSKLRKAHTIGNGARFRDVFFRDVDLGYIVGDQGLFWKTEDGGETWAVVEGMPSTDLNSIYVVDGKGFICGDEGMILQFQD